MTPRGMIFGADSIRAFQAGRKSQTRRVVAPGNSRVDGKGGKYLRRLWDILDLDTATPDRGQGPALIAAELDRSPYEPGALHRITPVVAAGDLVWVREGYAVGKGYDPERGQPRALPRDFPTYARIWYRADADNGEDDSRRGVWRSPLYLPRHLARIEREVARVRVQRVQQISAEDAVAEGCPDRWLSDYPNPRGWYERGWDELNADRGFPWAANPWVWAYGLEER